MCIEKKNLKKARFANRERNQEEKLIRKKIVRGIYIYSKYFLSTS